MKPLISVLLAIGVMIGVTGQAAAFENDNDRSTRNAKAFYEKLDSQHGD